MSPDAAFQFAAAGLAEAPAVSSPLAAPGDYDAVGEIMPDLAFKDADGRNVHLRGITEGLLVLSVSTVWCVPCNIYADDMPKVEAAFGTHDVTFAELLLEDATPNHVADIHDAIAWRDRYGLTGPVLTTNGKQAPYDAFVAGAAITAYPTYFVLDGTTGKIIERIDTGYGGVAEFFGEVDAAARTYYAAMPGITLNGSAAPDVLDGDGGRDSLSGGNGGDVLDGLYGNDNLDGGKGGDTLYGGAGVDRLKPGGGKGEDFLIGGGGNDVYLISDGRLDLDTILELTGGGVDTLTITRGGIVKLGSELPIGLELLNIQDPAAPVVFTPGENASVDWSFDWTVTELTFGRLAEVQGSDANDAIAVAFGGDLGASSHVLSVTGQGGDDQISAHLRDLNQIDLTNFIVSLDGGRGNDTLQGGARGDMLTGGSGADFILGWRGNDTLDGGPGADTLGGGVGDDWYLAGAGDTVSEDTVDRHSFTAGDLAGFFTFYGVNQAQFFANGISVPPTQHDGEAYAVFDSAFFGFTWQDWEPYLLYTLTQEHYFNAGGDYVFYTDGDTGGIDTVQTSAAAFTLPDQVENLILTGAGSGTGNAIDNQITGSALGDVLSGGDGADTLNGGGNADVLSGGAGSDTFVVGVAGSTTTILDFAAEDLLSLPSNPFATFAAFVSGAVTDDVAGLHVIFNSIHVFLDGVDLDDLTAANFGYVV